MTPPKLLPFAALGLLSISLVAQFWIGGVVIAAATDDRGYYLMLRDTRGEWGKVSAATYLAYHGIKTASLILALMIAVWALWRWLWHGGFSNNTPGPKE